MIVFFCMCLFGLELLVIILDLLFVNIGECINVIGSVQFCKLVKEECYEEVVDVVCQQVVNGVQIFDVNMDEGLIDFEKVMMCYFNLIMFELDIVCILVMVDFFKWSVIEVGLKCLQGKSVVNLILFKEGQVQFVEYVCKVLCYGVVVVVMVFDEDGQVDICVCKVEICMCVYCILVDEVGFLLQDIIFDLNIFVVVIGIEEYDNYVVDFIEVICIIKCMLLYCYVFGGVFNVLFFFCGNEMVWQVIYLVFLYYVIVGGMDMGIVNVGVMLIYDELDLELCECVEDVIFNCCCDGIECLLEIVECYKGRKGEVKGEDLVWCIKLIDVCLVYVLVYGLDVWVEVDIEEVWFCFSCLLDVIEGLLMDGMNVVGDLFGVGKMFLLQVVKFVCVMKKVVVYLLFFIEVEKVCSGDIVRSNGKIIMVMVKGDVYDIGKNIVGVVLVCNNFEVIDLGVMVFVQKIFDVVCVENVDIIGLFGLIIFLLEEMSYVVCEME